MNGYGHFEKLNEYFSKDRIYGGTALIGAYVYGPGDFNFTGGAHAKAMNLCSYTDDPSAISLSVFNSLLQRGKFRSIPFDLDKKVGLNMLDDKV